MKRAVLLAALAALSVSACSGKKAGLLAETSPNAATTVTPEKPPEGAPTPPPGVEDLPAGAYKIDPAHASFVLRVDHLGFSNYSMRFNKFDASMELNPKSPVGATLAANVDPSSIELNSPPAGFLDEIRGDKFLGTKKFPAITFKSTGIDQVNGARARVTGDLTLHGVTKPVTLDVKFNGGYPGMTPDPHARIGFSARGSLKRSDFGIGYGVPAPGTKMGVGDEVEMFIEAEFIGPDWKGPAK